MIGRRNEGVCKEYVVIGIGGRPFESIVSYLCMSGDHGFLLDVGFGLGLGEAGWSNKSICKEYVRLHGVKSRLLEVDSQTSLRIMRVIDGLTDIGRRSTWPAMCSTIKTSYLLVKTICT